MPFKLTSQSLSMNTGVSEVVQQYKLSIKKKREWSFLPAFSGIEPVIIQKHEKDSFKMIRMNELLGCLWYEMLQYCDPVNIILQGDSGSGKSFIAQKIMLDWASAIISFDQVFYLRCEELMCFSKEMNFIELLSSSCSLTSNQISQMLQQSSEKVLFIIDGFDELRLTQDIYDMSPNTDPLQKAPVEVVICGLMRRYIIPMSTLLVTTRTKNTVNKLLKGQQHFTEIMGFSESQVERYFHKFFSKEFDCVRANEALFTACSIPVICQIISEMFNVGANVTSGLETTTSIYVDFVSTLLDHHCQGLSQSVPTLLRSLGQLAERGMLEQQVLFDAESVHETIADPAGSPFLCKFLFKRRIRQETMFSFMHLSFQEFFTALYYVLLDEEESQKKLTQLLSFNSHLSDYGYNPSRFAAVVQFAFGLLNKDVRHTLRKKHGLVVHPKTQAHLKEWILKEFRRDILYSDRTLFWLYCLYELHEDDFVKEAMEAWNEINLCNVILKRTDCMALLYCSQCCQSIKELHLSDCRLTFEMLSMLLPALLKCKKLTLTPSELSDSSLDELMCTLMRGQTLRSLQISVDHHYNSSWECSVESVELSVSEETCSISIMTFPLEHTSSDIDSLSLTFLCTKLIDMEWTKLSPIIYQLIHKQDSDALVYLPYSSSKLKKMEMEICCLTKMMSVWILQISQNCPNLTELKVNAGYILEKGIKLLKKSSTRPPCSMTINGRTCSRQSEKCAVYGCYCGSNQQVKIHLNSQGFSMENLRKSLWD